MHEKFKNLIKQLKTRLRNVLGVYYKEEDQYVVFYGKIIVAKIKRNYFLTIPNNRWFDFIRGQVYTYKTDKSKDIKFIEKTSLKGWKTEQIIE